MSLRYNTMTREAATPMPIANSNNRKRKDLEEDEVEDNYNFERATNAKGSRQFASLPQGDQEAQFYPLPPDLNLQILANLGYNVDEQDMDLSTNMSDEYDHSNTSPSSSTSDLSPSTPHDVHSGSAESYFAKGLRSNTSPTYPNFNIYPEHVYPRPPGLLGMHMLSSYKSQTAASANNADGMEVDGDHVEKSNEAGSRHG